jgi:hypothetical protein
MRWFAIRSFIIISGILSAASALAATFTPATVAELIADILTANTNNQDDVIDLGHNTFTLVAAYSGVNGLPPIEADSGHTLLIENGTLQAAVAVRLLMVDLGANLSLFAVVLNQGNAGTGNGGGGAILVNGTSPSSFGTLSSVDNCTFSLNQGDIAGAIALSPYSVLNNVINTTFTNNTGVSFAATIAGGAIAATGALIGTIQNCTFSSNTGEGAGAIYLINFEPDSIASTVNLISNSTFSSNTSIAILLSFSSIGAIENSQFLSNTNPTGSGGAISALAGSIGTILGTTFSQNSATNAGAIALVELFSVPSSLNLLSNSSFQSNAATNGVGGAMQIVRSSIGSIEGSKFNGNTATSPGGALGFDASSIETIENTTFSLNRAQSGGALFLANGPNPSILNVLSNSAFIGNSALSISSSSDGGAIHLLGSNIGTIDSSTFSSNMASMNGGAISTLDGSINIIEKANFSNNGALGGAGGAMWLSSLGITPSTLNTVTASMFSNNTASIEGGAISIMGSEAQAIRDSTFSMNSTPGNGGAIVLHSTSTASNSLDLIVNSTFNANSAAHGGAIAFVVDSTFQSLLGDLSNSTISGNSASAEGGGIFLVGTTTVPATASLSLIGDLDSTIVANNTAPLGPDIFEGQIENIASESFNLIGNNSSSFLMAGFPNANNSYVGTAQMPIDPLLGPLEYNGGPTKTMALLDGSVAIDHGSNPLGLLFDQRGPNFHRMSGSLTDIGAFELQFTPIPECPSCSKRSRRDNHDGGNLFGAIPFPMPAPPPPLLPTPVAGIQPQAAIPPAAPATVEAIPANKDADQASVGLKTDLETSEHTSGCSSINGVGKSFSNEVMLLFILLAAQRAVRAKKRRSNFHA